MTDTQSSSRRLLSRSALVASGTLISKLSGFARLAVLAYVLGFTRLTDTYNLANETPNIVYELFLGGILTATFVPVFVDFFDRDDDESIHSVITVVIAVLTAITVTGVLAAPWIVQIFANRLSGADRTAQVQLATTLLRYFMPQMFFYGLAALAGALLNAKRKFGAPAFTPVLNNIVVVCALLLFGEVAGSNRSLLDVAGNTKLTVILGVGTTAGVAIMALALLPFVRGTGYHFRWRFAPRDPAVKRIVRLGGWTVGYVAANQIALWVILVLANARAGGVSAYLGAYVFFILPHGLFATSIMTALAPDLAAAWNARDARLARDRATTGLRLILAVIVPASFLEIVLGRPIVVALLQRGQFTASAAALTGDTLALFGIGLIAFSVYLFALRVFYASSDTRTPFLLNCAQNVINIGLAIWWYQVWGVRGLALAFSVSYIAAAIVAVVVVNARLHGLGWRGLASVAARVGIVSIVAAGAAWAFSRAVGWESPGAAWVATLGSLAIAGVIVAGGYYVMRVEEVRSVIGALKGRRTNTASTFQPDALAPDPEVPGVER